MVSLYCKLILEGRKTINDVPMSLRQQVKAELSKTNKEGNNNG
jgi:hypothetical protein